MEKNIKECLKKMCANCESKAKITKSLCPFRSISNEHCEEYEILEKALNGNRNNFKGLDENGALKYDDYVAFYNKDYEKIKQKLKVLEIVQKHKLLNYVVKNKKCSDMYNLTEEEIDKLKEWLDGKEN